MVVQFRGISGPLAGRVTGRMKLAYRILGLAVLAMAQLAIAQQTGLNIGENTKLNAGAMFTFGYQGDYGDAIPSSHGLDLGFDGKLSGSYYNPNFLSFTANPYYDQSRADSDYQSLTGSSAESTERQIFLPAAIFPAR